MKDSPLPRPTSEHSGLPPAMSLPKGIPTVRYQPPPLVKIPSGVQELPLIDQETPDSRKIQEIWTAKVRVFDLSKPDDLEDCCKVWQAVCDGHAKMCEHRTEFSSDKGVFVTLLRWVELDYNLPASSRGP